MKTACLITFLLFVTDSFLVAQEFENDSTSLLTSKVWKEGDEQFEVLYKFNPDGTFFCTFLGSEFLGIKLPSMDSMGKWEWISYDTFTMQTTQSITNGIPKDLNPQPYHKRVIHISRIDNRLLQGITHNILVNEDSEYAHQLEWRVKE